MILASNRFKSGFHQTHETVEDEADDTDGQDAEDDMLVDEAIVFLPQEPPDPRYPGQHLGGDNDEPSNPQAQPKAGKHIGHGGRDQSLNKVLIRDSRSTRATLR